MTLSNNHTEKRTHFHKKVSGGEGQRKKKHVANWRELFVSMWHAIIHTFGRTCVLHPKVSRGGGAEQKHVVNRQELVVSMQKVIIHAFAQFPRLHQKVSNAAWRREAPLFTISKCGSRF